MKRLDLFIEINRAGMDNIEPTDGHFNRFQERLNKTRYNQNRWVLQAVAALFITALISVNLLFFRSKVSPDLPLELKEAAWYYNSRSETLLSEIKSTDLMNNTEKQLIMKDMRNFEKEYGQLLSDMKKFPGDERLVNAFIDYHRSRTEFLEEILNQINVTNTL